MQNFTTHKASRVDNFVGFSVVFLGVVHEMLLEFQNNCV
jgi:hypothetical protein